MHGEGSFRDIAKNMRHHHMQFLRRRSIATGYTHSDIRKRIGLLRMTFVENIVTESIATRQVNNKIVKLFLSLSSDFL